MTSPFTTEIAPDWEGLHRCIRREGTPERVHHIELFIDPEVGDALCERYGVLDGLDESDRSFQQKRTVALQSFLGYDYVRCSIEDIEWPLHWLVTADSADLQRQAGRAFVDEHTGPITNWEEFERFEWPDPRSGSTRSLEWYEEHLPERMCVIGSGGLAHFAEYLTWLMGYETLCLSLYDQRDLVAAISMRLMEFYEVFLERLLRFDRVKLIWGSDDMGYRGGTLISPADLREFALPGHKMMAEMAHNAGRPYILHSCGNIALIMDDLINDVKIDAKHSFEDTIETVTDANELYGDRIAVLGGIDVDVLCRATETEVRKRVRDTLEACMPGGGYCLGTGNSVANYIPVENYIAMLDEGRRYSC